MLSVKKNTIHKKSLTSRNIKLYLTSMKMRPTSSIIILAVIIITFFTNSTDLLVGNNITVLTSPHYHNINAFLLNSLNKYHPLIFYLSALLIFMFLLHDKPDSSKLFYNMITIHTLFQKRVPVLMLNGFSLFLGS